MKRILFIGLILLLLAIPGLYLSIPAQITISKTSNIEVSEANAARFLLEEKNWSKWWPGRKDTHDAKVFFLNGQRYQIEDFTNSGLSLKSTGKQGSFESRIVFIAEDNLKVRITWTAILMTGDNLIKRLAQYQKAKQINLDVEAILAHLKTFLENGRNVYGLNIKLNKVKDSLTLATSLTQQNYPPCPVIAALVESLRKQIKLQGAAETNYPMLNVNQIGLNLYQVTVAIPVSRDFKPAKGMVINKLVLGNILEADVKGGPNTIKTAFNSIKIFAKDYRFTSPAMPFESMVTDRTAEKDTSKWMTKIYYPIF